MTGFEDDCGRPLGFAAHVSGHLAVFRPLCRRPLVHFRGLPYFWEDTLGLRTNEPMRPAARAETRSHDVRDLRRRRGLPVLGLRLLQQRQENFALIRSLTPFCVQPLLTAEACMEMRLLTLISQT